MSNTTAPPPEWRRDHLFRQPEMPPAPDDEEDDQ